MSCKALHAAARSQVFTQRFADSADLDAVSLEAQRKPIQLIYCARSRSTKIWKWNDSRRELNRWMTRISYR